MAARRLRMLSFHIKFPCIMMVHFLSLLPQNGSPSNRSHNTGFSDLRRVSTRSSGLLCLENTNCCGMSLVKCLNWAMGWLYGT